MKSEDLIERLEAIQVIAQAQEKLIALKSVSPGYTGAVLAEISALCEVAQKPTEYTATISDEELRLFDAIYSVVDANSFEQMCLWERFAAKHDEKLWVQGNALLLPIGRHDGMWVNVSCQRVNIFGKGVIFIDPVSMVVDHNMVEQWLDEIVPDSARMENGRIRRSNAMNFHNAKPRQEDGELS